LTSIKKCKWKKGGAMPWSGAREERGSFIIYFRPGEKKREPENQERLNWVGECRKARWLTSEENVSTRGRRGGNCSRFSGGTGNNKKVNGRESKISRGLGEISYNN